METLAEMARTDVQVGMPAATANRGAVSEHWSIMAAPVAAVCRPGAISVEAACQERAVEVTIDAIHQRMMGAQEWHTAWPWACTTTDLVCLQVGRPITEYNCMH